MSSGTHANTRFKLWGSEIHEQPPEIEHEEVMESEKAVAKWTAKIVSKMILETTGAVLNM